jgi:hypothetical protein
VGALDSAHRVELEGDTRRLNKSLLADLDQLQKAVTGRDEQVSGQSEEPHYAEDGDAQSRK